MRNPILVVCALALASVCAAQVPVQERPVGPPRGGGVPGGGVPGAREFIVQEGMLPGHIVKGAPFSADTYTELRQTLGDGNVIERKQSGATYRDSEGRTRIEQPVGPGVPAGAGAGEVIIIRDPVAGMQWTLNPATKTGVKVELPAPGSHMPAGVPGGGGPAMRQPHERAEGPGRPPLGENRNVEKLGTQNINGVQAEGTRVTITIPAGQIGNVRPIEIVNERWYSPQLQTLVKSRNVDPRTGDHVFEMTNIRLGEPPATLFQPPADYRIEQGRRPMEMQQQMRHQRDSAPARRPAPAHEL